MLGKKKQCRQSCITTIPAFDEIRISTVFRRRNRAGGVSGTHQEPHKTSRVLARHRLPATCGKRPDGQLSKTCEPPRAKL